MKRRYVFWYENCGMLNMRNIWISFSGILQKKKNCRYCRKSLVVRIHSFIRVGSAWTLLSRKVKICRREPKILSLIHGTVKTEQSGTIEVQMIQKKTLVPKRQTQNKKILEILNYIMAVVSFISERIVHLKFPQICGKTGYKRIYFKLKIKRNTQINFPEYCF